VGKPKAVVAAQRVQERVAGVTVTAHFCRIEDMPLSFYEEFTVIVLGLDSLEARRYMNGVACSLLRKHTAASSSGSGCAGISLQPLCELRSPGTAPAGHPIKGSCLLDLRMLRAAALCVSLGCIACPMATCTPVHLSLCSCSCCPVMLLPCKGALASLLHCYPGFCRV
jgi:hypothetical protein